MNETRKAPVPSKYRTEFCDLLIDHMAQGYSFDSFGGLKQIRVSRNCLYQWKEKYPEFDEAKSIGELACLLLWEQIGLNRSNGRIQYGCAASYIFNMKNRFLWRDKIEIDSNKNESKTITLKYALTKKESDTNQNNKGVTGGKKK